MSIFRRAMLGACTLSLLSACNFDVGSGSSISSGSATLANAGSSPVMSGGGSSSGPVGLTTGTTPTPPVDAVTATPSVSGTVSVSPGASQTITVAFTSADGRPVSGLALSNTTLPSDWVGPSSFTCPATDSGSNCVLTLTYMPTALETGTLKVSYVYVGDNLAPPGATLTIPYAAVASNNVVATPTPIGQINAVVGSGSQSVSVNFTTDDGNAATALTLPGLSVLPTGWSTLTPGFSCAIISNGSGCQLVLNYAPRAAGSGTLNLGYDYTDGTGAARTGTINLPYSSTADGTVVASVAPTGQINAVETLGTQPVTVTFTTDNGQVASSFAVLSPLASLPAGWKSSVSGFTCATVSTGSGCQLALSYAPATLTNGTLTLKYSYASPAGVFTTGSVNIPYAATTNDNVIATAAPSGQINAIVGEVSPNLAVTFTTDDARTATALLLTTNLVTLPAGWTSTDSSFSCAGVGGGASCQLPLTYAPGAAASGTMTLRYTYLNNAGQAKSGSLNIPYRATTDDTIVGTSNPVSLSVTTGTSTPVTVTFATDDGNPASLLAVTSDLSSLPAGWSSTGGTFSCATVSTGTACQLPLTYLPTNPDSGTLTLDFSYTNDSGSVKTGTVLIPYTATP